MRVIMKTKWSCVALALFFYSVQSAGADEIFQFGINCLNCFPAPENPSASVELKKTGRKGARQQRGARPASILATYPTTR